MAEIKVENLKPLNLTDAEYKFCDEEVRKIYLEDKKLYDKASSVVRQLGMGGLWRGISASILVVAKAIKEGAD